jgi:hypothetical protein
VAGLEEEQLVVPLEHLDRLEAVVALVAVEEAAGLVAALA